MGNIIPKHKDYDLPAELSESDDAKEIDDPRQIAKLRYQRNFQKRQEAHRRNMAEHPEKAESVRVANERFSRRLKSNVERFNPQRKSTRTRGSSGKPPIEINSGSDEESSSNSDEGYKRPFKRVKSNANMSIRKNKVSLPDETSPASKTTSTTKDASTSIYNSSPKASSGSSVVYPNLPASKHLDDMYESHGTYLPERIFGRLNPPRSNGYRAALLQPWRHASSFGLPGASNQNSPARNPQRPQTPASATQSSFRRSTQSDPASTPTAFGRSDAPAPTYRASAPKPSYPKDAQARLRTDFGYTLPERRIDAYAAVNLHLRDPGTREYRLQDQDVRVMVSRVPDESCLLDIGSLSGQGGFARRIQTLRIDELPMFYQGGRAETVIRLRQSENPDEVAMHMGLQFVEGFDSKLHFDAALRNAISMTRSGGIHPAVKMSPNDFGSGGFFAEDPEEIEDAVAWYRNPEEAPEPVTTERTCVVCDEALPVAQFPKPNHACEHTPNTCGDCINDWVTSQLDSGLWDRIHCPDSDCPHTLTAADIQRLCPKDVFNHYNDDATKALLSQDDDFELCLAPGCRSGQIHVSKTDGPIFTCYACGFKQCVVHSRAWHTGETCDEFTYRTSTKQQEEEASTRLVQQISKRCPECKSPIEKNNGCDHMTCRKCRHEFCWLCLAPYGPIYAHGNHRHAKTCTYNSRRSYNSDSD